MLSSTVYTLPADHASLVRATTVDVEENTLLVASERVNVDDVTIQVWKVNEEDRLVSNSFSTK